MTDRPKDFVEASRCCRSLQSKVLRAWSSWRRSKYQAASLSAMLAIAALDQSPGPRTGGNQSPAEFTPNFMVGPRRRSALIPLATFDMIRFMATSSVSATIGIGRKTGPSA